MTTDESNHSGDGETVVDWQVATSLTAGDDALLDELIALFPAESARHLNDIRCAIAAADAARLTRGAHSLKSAAAMFGATRLSALALAVERLGEASDIAEASARLPELHHETARLAAALEHHRSQQRGA